MKKILIILVLGFVSLGSLGAARAEEPFVYLTVPKKVKLGTVLMWDSVIPDALTLKVNSNCLHGSIIASLSSLKNVYGAEIGPERISIRTAFTGGFVSMEKPVAISEPAFGAHDVVIDFHVKANGPLDRAGKYTGTIAFTVMPPPLLSLSPKK